MNSKRISDITAVYAEVLATLLEKKAEDRFASAAELGDVLEQGEGSDWWADREAALLRSRTSLPAVPVRRETQLFGRDFRRLGVTPEVADDGVLLFQGRFLFPLVAPPRRQGIPATKEKRGDDASDGAEEVGLEGDARFRRQYTPDHAAIEKEHDHGQGHGEPVAAQHAHDEDEEHHPVGEPAGTEVGARPGEQPHAKARGDPDQRQRNLRGAGEAIEHGRAEDEQRQRVADQMLERGVRQRSGEHAVERSELTWADAERIDRKSKRRRRNMYRPEHGGEERGDGGGALERDFAHAKEYKYKNAKKTVRAEMF